MKSSFDQQIKQQLEQSSPEDLGYTPDRDNLWSRIEAKQNRKRLPLRMWLSHAAAIAAGLVIGSYFLTTYRQDTAQQDISQTEQHTTAVLAKQDTLQSVAMPGQHNPSSVTTQARSTRSHIAPAPRPVTQQQPEPVIAAQPQPEPGPLPAGRDEEPTVIAQAAQPKVKVLHLMDMRNENTKLMQAEHPQPETRWAWLLPEQAEKSGTESFSAQVVKHILHPKNN